MRRNLILLLVMLLFLTACGTNNVPNDAESNKQESTLNENSSGDLADSTEQSMNPIVEEPASLVSEPEQDAGITVPAAENTDIKSGLSVNDIYDSILAENEVIDPAEITRLDLYDKGLDLLDGIERFPNLTDLTITANKISDITPLKDLKKLKSLLLGSNRVKDISVLAELPELEAIYMHNNQIESVLPLAKLQKLGTVTLEGNNINSLEGLEEVHSLTKLYLARNDITDISPIRGLAGLETLYLAGNNIRDISALMGLTKIESLNLSDNKIEDITPMEGLIALRNVELKNNMIKDLSPLVTMCENGGLSGDKYKGVDYDVDLRDNDLDQAAKDQIKVLQEKYNVRVSY